MLAPFYYSPLLCNAHSITILSNERIQAQISSESTYHYIYEGSASDTHCSALIVRSLISTVIKPTSLLQSAPSKDDVHHVADVAGARLLPPAQLHPQGRQAREHPPHQGGRRQALRLRLRQDL
jgi:hypothetical protein